MSQEQLVNR